MLVFEDTTFNDLSDQTLATSLSQQHPVVMVLNGADLGARFILNDASYIIGRHPEKANIVLNDRAVSAMHTRIDYDAREQAFFITDLKSKNGIWVNSRRIESGPLSPGDKVFIGRTILKFNVEDAFEDSFHSNVDKLMNIDELTGLPVKRIFDHKLSVVFVKATQRRKPLSLLMMDMDGLKSINDTYGHQMGSYAISECGKIIGEIIDGSGRACRYGGDEFIAYLRNTPLQEAMGAAERIRMTIASHNFKRKGQRITPKISIGLAEVTEATETAEDLVRHADEALYRAKEAGRNIVCT